jgi:hypothetical protein
LFLAALVATVLFAVCAIFMLLSEGAAEIMGRLLRRIAHEARDLVRGLTERVPAVGLGPTLGDSGAVCFPRELPCSRW